MGKLDSKYLKIGFMLFMASYLSGIVSVILGQQGVLEFLFVFLFIVFGTIALLIIDKKLTGKEVL